MPEIVVETETITEKIGNVGLDPTILRMSFNVPSKTRLLDYFQGLRHHPRASKWRQDGGYSDRQGSSTHNTSMVPV